MGDVPKQSIRTAKANFSSDATRQSQQTTRAAERMCGRPVKHQRRTTRSDCRHSSPRYFPLWKQVVTLANPFGGPPTSGPNAQSIGLASLCRCLLLSPLVFAASKHLKGGMRKQIFKGLVISNLRRSNCDETASCPHRPCFSGWRREQGPIQSFKKQFCSCHQRNGQM
jgi:hypothetical protein